MNISTNINKQFQSNMDDHIILGIPPDSSSQTIRKAYLRLSLSFHPDRNPSKTAKEEFQRLKDAYQREYKKSLSPSPSPSPVSPPTKRDWTHRIVKIIYYLPVPKPMIQYIEVDMESVYYRTFLLVDIHRYRWNVWTRQLEKKTLFVPCEYYPEITYFQEGDQVFPFLSPSSCMIRFSVKDKNGYYVNKSNPYKLHYNMYLSSKNIHKTIVTQIPFFKEDPISITIQAYSVLYSQPYTMITIPRKGLWNPLTLVYDDLQLHFRTKD